MALIILRRAFFSSLSFTLFFSLKLYVWASKCKICTQLIIIMCVCLLVPMKYHTNNKKQQQQVKKRNYFDLQTKTCNEKKILWESTEYTTVQTLLSRFTVLLQYQYDWLDMRLVRNIYINYLEDFAHVFQFNCHSLDSITSNTHTHSHILLICCSASIIISCLRILCVCLFFYLFFRLVSVLL